MATTKIIPGVLDLTQASSSTGLRMPKGAAYSGAAADPAMVRNSSEAQSAGSLNVMQHFNGTNWKNYENVVECTTSTCGYPPAASSNALALYQLQSDGGTVNNVPDTCGSYDGTASNITYAAGEFGNAAVFNGSNSSILATSPTQGNTDASYSFWIKTPTILSYNNTNPNYPVFGQVSDASRNPFSIYWHASTTSGKMAFGIWRCFNNQIWYPAGYFTDFEFTYVANTWYHIVITYTASDKSCRNYVNGTQIGAAPTLSLLGSSFIIGTQMKLGSYNNNQGVPFNGSLDQIRIYDSVLSQNDVDDLHTEVAC
jgi:hypothetical protein|tara:strand:+ start:228 stop:1163 length:936 start_codon:yes stop_codon:yes gene_type:complete